MGKKDDLREKIQILNNELERLESMPDFDAMEDGTVLAVVFQRRASGRTVQIVGLKEAGRWSFTGGRDTPDNATGDHVAEWLTGTGKQVVAVEVLARLELVRLPEVDLWTGCWPA